MNKQKIPQTPFMRAYEREKQKCSIAFNLSEQSRKKAPDECICKGNWRLIVSECESKIGGEFVRVRTGEKYTFFGVVHSDDDYYYGMYGKDGDLGLLSCVIGLDEWGFEEVDG